MVERWIVLVFISCLWITGVTFWIPGQEGLHFQVQSKALLAGEFFSDTDLQSCVLMRKTAGAVVNSLDEQPRVCLLHKS